MADLDIDLIAAAALAIVDQNGLQGFSMRAVAKSLGVTPMALYHHVRNKAELAALVVDAANTEHPLPVPSGDWREDLWVMAKISRDSMMAHPGVAELRRQYRVWTPEILKKSQYWVGLWQQTGLPPDKAVQGAVISSVAILGLITEGPLLVEQAPPDERLLESRPEARQLLTFSMDWDAMFELGVRSLIDGVHARLMQPETGEIKPSAPYSEPRERSATKRHPTR